MYVAGVAAVEPGDLVGQRLEHLSDGKLRHTEDPTTTRISPD